MGLRSQPANQKHILPFMEPEGLLLHPQEPTTCSYLKPNKLSSLIPTKIKFRVILHLNLRLSCDLFFQVFQPKLALFSISSICATCPIYLILILILSNMTKWWSSSLCKFLQPTATSSLLGPNIVISTIFLTNTLCLCVPPLTWQTKFYTHIKHRLHFSTESDQPMSPLGVTAEEEEALQHKQ
jgi:hypothetical protein